MICTYENYKGVIKEISFETCLGLHSEIAAECSGDPDAEELYDDLIVSAIDYAGMRALWTIKDNDWKASHDDKRTSYHDGLIISVNVLARYLQKAGKAAAWRDTLGYETDKGGLDRKRIGDFGCFLAFVHGINGR